jgi:hypothetical protein
MEQNWENPEIMKIAKIATEEADAMKKKGDLSSFDFASLASTIKKGTLWRINTELTDQIDRNGEYHELTKSGVDGLRPVFFLTCSALDLHESINSAGILRPQWYWRLVDNSIGLPTSAEILK